MWGGRLEQRRACHGGRWLWVPGRRSTTLAHCRTCPGRHRGWGCSVVRIARRGLLPSSSDLSRPTGRQDLRRPASRTNKSACAEMLFLPACPTRSASPAGPGRNFWFHFFRNRDCLSPSRLVARGVRVVTDVRGDAMAATGCARRAHVGTDMKWQRPDTPMLVLRSRRRRCAARIMVARKPGAPGRLPISVKTIAQGRPGRSG